VTDLDDKEQRNVRIALRYLQRRTGGWAPLARVLGFQPDTVEKVGNARGRSVTARIAFRVARLLDVAVDDLLSGRGLPSACPCCGYVPDFVDEPTVAEVAPRPDGLKLVK
jgi:hypothetical protein